MALAGNDILIVQRPATQDHYKLKVSDLLSGGEFHVPTLSAPPSSAVSGDLYWDNTVGTLFIYFDDGVNPNWVPATPVPDAPDLNDIDGGTY